MDDYSPSPVSSPLPQGNGSAHPTQTTIVRKKLMGYVGFANLPNQVHRKSVKKGFQFTVMVVGAWRPLCRRRFLC